MRAPDLPSATETGAVAMARPRRLGLMMAALCALLPPAAIGGGMLMAPLQALAGLIAGSTVSWRRGGPLATAAGLLLMAFALWIALSTAWSAVQRPEQGVKIVGAAATGVVLIAGVAASGGRDRALMRAALAAGLLVLCVYGAVEALFDM
ncbi:MAG: hypothetical protein NW200_09940, partial [Hyphomonadaceae bacterium]|nr:hypothetical protein [Hyphomonadaceae bacterium]